MTSIEELTEIQKHREIMWVNEGVERFHRNLEGSDPTLTPAGKALLKRCHGALENALDGFLSGTPLSQGRVPGSARALRDVLVLLGVRPVAAITLHSAVMLGLSPTDTGSAARNFIKASAKLAHALEHDMRYRAAVDVGGSVADAVKRLKRDTEKGRMGWWRAAKAMRDLIEIPWENTEAVVFGLDLFGILCDACPDVFSVNVSRVGARTVRFLKVSHDVIADLTLDTAAIATMTPRSGMMVVPPRDWRYSDDP